ncbi:MAG TPA: dockerin type I repeat-containing protein, partial [Pirellulales bacterium]
IDLDLKIHVRAIANILPGDVNFDGVVNEADRAVIQAHLGQANPHGLGIGDANGDGIVNGNDFRLVPEPATLVSFACGAALLAAVRWGRQRTRAASTMIA